MLYTKLKKIANTLKKFLIPSFCLIHMAAIFGWSLSNGILGTTVESAGHSIATPIFETFFQEGSTGLTAFLQRYIDMTGNQQYWDFFAPQSPKYHQYLSVCGSIETYQSQGKITCKGQTGFSNLDAPVEIGQAAFKVFGSNRSRYYRLTENLSKLEDRDLLEAFTRYYRFNNAHKKGEDNTTYLVLHLFELHPELDDLPKAGYRMDKVLLSLP